MTAIDPYRTLGLTPGASQAEIKRAYRHLAKLYHPDSAGDRALGRFLAIQAAYEALIDDQGRGRGYRRSSLDHAHVPTATVCAVAGRRLAGSRDARSVPGADATGRDDTGRAAGGRSRRVERRPIGGRPRRARRSTSLATRRRPELAVRIDGRRRSRIRYRRGSDGWPPPAQPGAEGDDRIDELRRRRQGAVRSGLGGRYVVRRRERHVLDAQPEGIRRPAQARPRVPRPIETPDAGRHGGGRDRRGPDARWRGRR